MIEFMKKGIQRTSIELSEANYELVHLYASLANGKLTYVLNYIIKMMVKRSYRLYHIRSIYGVFFYLFRKIRLKKEFLV